MKKGLLVTIYKSSNDCTNGGVTAKANSIILTGEGVPEIFSISEGDIYLKLVKRNLGGSEYLHAEPVGQGSKGVGFMFGGNFIHTSDSRFVSKYPIPVHDRSETPREYEILSR